MNCWWQRKYLTLIKTWNVKKIMNVKTFLIYKYDIRLVIHNEVFFIFFILNNSLKRIPKKYVVFERKWLIIWKFFTRENLHFFFCKYVLLFLQWITHLPNINSPLSSFPSYLTPGGYQFDMLTFKSSCIRWKTRGCARESERKIRIAILLAEWRNVNVN